MKGERPPRAELFGFYYLGFRPDGKYRFPNAHHVAGYYGVSASTVMDWLEQLDLDPRHVLGQKFDLAGAAVELQMEAPALELAGIQNRIAAILAELDKAEGGRRAWED